MTVAAIVLAAALPMALSAQAQTAKPRGAASGPAATTTTNATVTPPGGSGDKPAAPEQQNPDVPNQCATPGVQPTSAPVNPDLKNPDARANQPYWFGGCNVAGVLSIPFKVQLTGKQEVMASANVAGFYGWQPAAPWSSSGAVFLGFVGFGQNLTNGSSANGGNSAQNFVSYGLGIMVPVGGLFRVTAGNATANKCGGSNGNAPNQCSRMTAGVLIGWDHTTKNAGYAYNNKPWIGLQLGASF